MEPEEIVRAIATLEANSKSYWEQHDRQAKEFRDDVKHELKKLNSLPCSVNTDRIQNVEKRLSNIEWAVIGTVIVGLIAFIMKKVLGA